MLNIVNRVILYLQFYNEDQAFSTRQQFASSVATTLETIIDQVCADYLPAGHILQIDSLEIDIGSLGAYNAVEHFAEEFRYRFSQALMGKIAVSNPAQLQSQESRSQLAALQHFLSYGVLPWYFNRQQFNFQSIVSELAVTQAKALYQFLEKNKTSRLIWQRLARQLSFEVQGIIIQLFPELVTAEVALSQSLIIAAQIEGDQVVDINEQQLQQLRKAVLEEAPVIFENSGSGESILTLLQNQRKKRSGNVNFPTDLKQFIRVYKQRAATSIEPDKLVQQQQLNQLQQMQLTSQTDEPESFFSNNAGLLLLSPFFSDFLARCKLRNKTGWTSDLASTRAVYLLHYLATGAATAPEYVLVLEKIFCGIPLAQPLDEIAELTEPELAECSDLLLSAIKHWQVLKNTSISGLRNAFLQREGIITQADNGYLIRVERKTHDVLLDSIPWGYSNMVFSWLPYIIKVEW